MAGRWGISRTSWTGGHGTYLVWQDTEPSCSLTLTCVSANLHKEYPGYFEMLDMDEDATSLVIWGREAGHRNWEFCW